MHVPDGSSGRPMQGSQMFLNPNGHTRPLEFHGDHRGVHARRHTFLEATMAGTAESSCNGHRKLMVATTRPANVHYNYFLEVFCV
jgi:hypothetical protein